MYAASYCLIEKGGTLSGFQQTRMATEGAAVYSGSYLEARDNSTVIARAQNGKYGIHTKTYLSILRGSKVTANGYEYGIYSGSYFSILDNSAVKAIGESGFGMYANTGYASICRNSTVDANGTVTGIRVNLYFSVLDGSTLNAVSSHGTGARAEKQYVSVLRGSTMTAKGRDMGVYANSYMSVLTGSTLYGEGNIGLQSDEYIHTNGAGSLVQGQGQSVGVLCKGNGGDSIFADCYATLLGEATASESSVGIQIYNKGRIAARSGATVQGTGVRTGIETVNGYAEASNATLKGVSHNINSGYAAISASAGVKGICNGKVVEEYLSSDVQLEKEPPYYLTAQHASVGRSVANIGNYQWDFPTGSVAVSNNGFVAQQDFTAGIFTGLRTTNVKGEPVVLSGGATHQVSVSVVSATAFAEEVPFGDEPVETQPDADALPDDSNPESDEAGTGETDLGTAPEEAPAEPLTQPEESDIVPPPEP